MFKVRAHKNICLLKHGCGCNAKIRRKETLVAQYAKLRLPRDGYTAWMMHTDKKTCRCNPAQKLCFLCFRSSERPITPRRLPRIMSAAKPLISCITLSLMCTALLGCKSLFLALKKNKKTVKYFPTFQLKAELHQFLSLTANDGCLLSCFWSGHACSDRG